MYRLIQCRSSIYRYVRRISAASYVENNSGGITGMGGAIKSSASGSSAPLQLSDSAIRVGIAFSYSAAIPLITYTATDAQRTRGTRGSPLAASTCGARGVWGVPVRLQSDV
eukprot:GHVR01178715.1.p1 GENE.GHVR01178715.1~~GHVR01178715.1.p1  ORF type:complete len:111 (+),score=18.26 GHVR01178715.1:43-375(+)